MTLARTPYARLSPADIGQVDRELKKLEQMSAGLYVPKVLVHARSPYAVLATDTMLLCDCTAGPITLTFPLAARVDGMAVVVIKSDTTTNAVTLSGTFSGVVNPTITVAHDAFTVVAMNGAYHLTALVLYPIQTWETGVVDLRYTYGDVRRYGALCDGATDDSAAVQAYLNLLATTSRRQVIFPPGRCKIGSTLAVTVQGVQFIGNSSSDEPGTLVEPGTTLLFSGTGPMVKLGENRTRTILSITRAGGVVTVTYAAMYPGFQSGSAVTITGCSDPSFNGGFTLTSGSFSSNTSTTFNQAGPDASSSGGTLTSNFDNGEYDDVASKFTMRDLICTTSNPTTPLLNGKGNYTAGAKAIEDWRNGGIILDNVEFSTFEYGVWGICSDINRWRNVTFRENHFGFYLGPRSDQFVFDASFSKFNDSLCILDSVSKSRFDNWESDTDGSATTGAVQIISAYNRGCGGITFNAPDLENFSGTGVYPAFIQMGVGSAFQVRQVVINDPGIFTHTAGQTPRTQYLVSMENADGVYVRGPHDTANNNTMQIDGIVECRGASSPQHILIERGFHSITTPLVNSGTGAPVYAVSDPSISRELVADGVTNQHLVLRSSVDRNVKGTVVVARDSLNGTTMRFDPLPSSGTLEAVIEFFKSVNTTGVRKVVVYRGDGSTNAAYTLDVTTGVTISNGLDSASGLTLDSGLTATQNAQFTFKDRGSAKWNIGKNGSNQYIIFDFAAAGGGATRMKMFPAAGMTFSPGAANQQATITDFAGATQIAIDYDAGIGTFYGGVRAGQTGTLITRTMVYTPSLTPASVAAASVAEQTFTVTGLTTADKVIVNPPATANNVGISGARVSAADTLAVRFVNPTAGALTPTAGTYAVLALRS